MTRAYALALGAGIHPDQAALHGLLVKVRDLGVTLLSVELVEPSDTGPDGRAAEE